MVVKDLEHTVHGRDLQILDYFAVQSEGSKVTLLPSTWRIPRWDALVPGFINIFHSKHWERTFNKIDLRRLDINISTAIIITIIFIFTFTSLLCIWYISSLDILKMWIELGYMYVKLQWLSSIQDSAPLDSDQEKKSIIHWVYVPLSFAIIFLCLPHTDIVCNQEKL